MVKRFALGLTKKGVDEAYDYFSNILKDKTDTEKVKSFFDHVKKVRSENSLQGQHTKQSGYLSPLYDDPKTIALAKIAKQDVKVYGSDMLKDLNRKGYAFKDVNQLNNQLKSLDGGIKKRGYINFVKGTGKEKGRGSVLNVKSEEIYEDGNSLYKAMSEPNFQKELNKKLKNLNLKSTISARDAASVLGISYEKFHNILRGLQRTDPGIVSVGRNRVLNVNLNKLITKAKKQTTETKTAKSVGATPDNIKTIFRDKWEQAFKKDFPDDFEEARVFLKDDLLDVQPNIDHIKGFSRGLQDLGMGSRVFQKFVKDKTGKHVNNLTRGEASKLTDDFIELQRTSNPEYINLPSILGKNNLQQISFEMNTPGIIKGSKGTFYDGRYHNIFSDDEFLKRASDEANNIRSFFIKDTDFEIDHAMFNIENLKNLKKLTAASVSPNYKGFNASMFNTTDDLTDKLLQKQFTEQARKRIFALDKLTKTRTQKVIDNYNVMSKVREVEGFKTPALPIGIQAILKDAGLKNVFNKGGRVEMDEGGTAFDALIKQNQEEHGMELKDAIDEAIKEMLERKNYADGGRVGYAEGNRVIPSASQRTIGGGSTRTIGGPTNKVGTIESMLAGIGAGLIDIPRGAFVLGSALMDMGLGTNNAAKVEKFFDELTDLDEKADATTIGGIVRLLTNLGVPGAQAWNMGTKAATKALLAKRNGNYFRITDPKLEERMKTALNGKGRLYATLGGAGAVGVSDAIFIGDVNKAGTLGDMFGGPTQLNENDENDSSKEVMNRMKFGLDSSLMMGVIGGTGSAIKTAVKRRNDLSSDNDALDRFLSKLRPRGDKPQEFFEMERANIGKRAGDVNYAGEVARSLDKHIDGIFPFVINPFNKMGNNGRKEFMKELNDVLLSGSPEIGVTGRFDFGDLDPEMVKTLTAKMKKMGAKQSDIDGVFKEFYNIRGGWGHMFSRLGAKMDKANLDEFRTLFSKKFSNYLGSTYEIFQNKSIIPMLNYRPSEEAVNKAIVMFKQSAKEAGEEITDAQARHYVDKMVEGARLPSSPTSGLYLDVPDFFANRTILDDLGGKNKIGYENFTDDAKQVVNELLGKIEDPMQTVLAGTGRLSLIARRNEFYNDLIKRSKEEIAAGNKGFFYDDEAAAINALGSNIKKVEIDPSRTIEAGITNPMNGMYAEKAVAEAIEQSAMIQRDKEWYTQMYDSFILYPKATSQIAKTILSPITHVRNFVSAGAFAGANGLLPGVTVSPDKMAMAMKDAYRALQTNLPGSRIANDEYRELLRLGVVNSNVRLGDLQRLLKDVQFGETLSAQTGLRGLTKQLSKVKKWTEDMYTAEDDFWKITSYALERQRLNDAYAKVGIKVDPKALNEEAASIVRNNIPNYDMVNEFVKGLRRLPFGNFVSFPAEIMRTTTNILGRALKEINYQHTLDDGRVVNPLRGIGMKRLFGLGATTFAVPYGVVEGAKTLYDVSGAEMDALRRFVPEWSRNSTLVPIKDRETGELKYIDFSHTNAYDTMIRPINTMINSIGKGVDEGEIMKNVAVGMFDATKETFSPFMSESIWFEAASDIILRGGRTREGRRLYTDETPWGEKVSIVAGHIAKTQVPGSVEAFKRLDLAIEGVDIVQKGKYDKYGRTYELGDELLGFAGARAVKVDPLRSMKFKIADYRTGVNNARREFTTPLLRGGPINAADIVDRYAIANEALYKVNKELFNDYYAARILGTKENAIDGQFADRVSTAQLNAIKTGRFKPFIPSENIIKAFGENARAIGERNPYRLAETQINRMAEKYNNLPLYDTTFPIFDNPFKVQSNALPAAATNNSIAPVGGLSPGSVVQTGMTNPLINNRTMQQGQRVFGSTDPIFGN